MSEHNETLAEVLAEMRIFKCRNLETGELELCNAIANYFADRIEAAYKREGEKLNSVIQATVSRSDAEIDRLRREVAELRKQIGNAAKLREAVATALKTLNGIINGSIAPRSNTVFDCRDEIKAALVEPARNCDAGRAGEQAKRLSEWCNGRHCINCQFKGGWPDECKLQWAQLPYEEGGAKR